MYGPGKRRRIIGEAWGSVRDALGPISLSEAEREVHGWLSVRGHLDGGLVPIREKYRDSGYFWAAYPELAAYLRVLVASHVAVCKAARNFGRR